MRNSAWTFARFWRLNLARSINSWSGLRIWVVLGLVLITGSKALRRAVLDVFDQPVIQRCQLHKVRNVKDKLPERLRRIVERRMRQAYRADSALDAEAQLLALARELERSTPVLRRVCAKASRRR